MIFLSPDIFKLQVDKILFPMRTFKLMVHLKRPEKWLPLKADTLSSDDWIEIKLY